MITIKPNDVSYVTCDVCNQEVLPEYAKFLRIYENSRMSPTNKVLHTIDICPVCYDKLCGHLWIER